MSKGKEIRNFLLSSSFTVNYLLLLVIYYLRNLWMVIWRECITLKSAFSHQKLYSSFVHLNFFISVDFFEVNVLEIQQNWQHWYTLNLVNSFQSFLQMFEISVMQKIIPEYIDSYEIDKKIFSTRPFIAFLNWGYFSNFSKVIYCFQDLLQKPIRSPSI